MRRVRSIGWLVVVSVMLVGSCAGAAAGVTWKQCLQQSPAWYASGEALRIADNVVLYQRTSGGWPKNLDMAGVVDDAGRARLAGERSEFGGTIDNGATTSQLRFLARVAVATGEVRLRESILRGLEYLHAAQYLNGGWPQNFPKSEGYSRHVTFNDNAMVNVLWLLQDVARGGGEYAWLDAVARRRAAEAVDRGVGCILKCQVIVAGRRTGWCAQHDAQTLAPAPARSYEKISLSGSESVGIIRFLMNVEKPSREVRESVESAVLWLSEVKLSGIRLVERANPSLPRGRDLVVVPDAQAPPIWARFYEIGTNRPIFAGRDGVIKRSLAEIEPERRTGYAWYTDAPAKLIGEEYSVWRERQGLRE